MQTRKLLCGLAVSLLAFQRAVSAPQYIYDFNQFPAFPYNTAEYQKGGGGPFVGCGPTTGAMMLAYFQTIHSLTGLLVDPGVVLEVDLGLNTAWALHGGTYMKTGADGFGNVNFIKPGLENYAKDRGFELKVVIHVGPSYSDPNSADAAWLNAYGAYGEAWMNDAPFWIKNPNGTWKIDPDLFCDFVAVPLSAGIPIFLTIDTKAAGNGDHWVPLVGYDRTSKQYAFYNTYDTNLHWADIYYMNDPAGHKVNSISMVRTVQFIPSVQPDIAADFTALNFGAVEIGDNSVKYLTVSNTGAADLSVTQIDHSGPNASDFTIINTEPFTLMPGNARQIGVRFKPSGSGSRSATMVLYSNDPDESPLSIGLTGSGGNPSGGVQWQNAASPGAGGINCLAVQGTRVYTGTLAGGVLASTDGGYSWTPVNEGLTNLDVRMLVVSESKVYAGTWGDGIFVSADSGAHWNQIKNGMTNLFVTCLAIDPPGVSGYQRLLAGTWGGGVFLTTSHGQSWTELTSGMTETHVRSVLLFGSHLFAGTINGLFRSSDGQPWTTINNGLTNTGVISLLRRGPILFAGTDGGGVFYSDNGGDDWFYDFLNQDSRTVPDLASIDITLFAATWGAGVFRKSEDTASSDAMDGGLSELNVRCLALLSKGDGSGKWNLLAGTENGNIWSWPLEKTYPIVVDGEKDAFYNGLSGPEDGFLRLRSYAWNDNGQPASDDDLSARIWTAWDDKRFYLYEEVADNALSGNAVNVWEEDCIELKFDPQPTDTTVNSVWDTRMTALDDATQGVVAWDNLNNVSQDPQRQWFRKTIPGGYALELAVEWSAIQSAGETITPQAGTEFGMAINQHDNDGDARRKATVQWAAVLKDAVWNTPKYLGTVKLLTDHKMQFIPTNKMTGVTNPVPYDGSDYSRTGIAEAGARPATFALGQNYPNPFNPVTVIAYSLPAASEVRLSVVDIRGREVSVPVNGPQQAGVHHVIFNAGGLASGLYFYRLEAGPEVLIRKMIVSR
jgi:hypothetical protein